MSFQKKIRHIAGNLMTCIET